MVIMVPEWAEARGSQGHGWFCALRCLCFQLMAGREMSKARSVPPMSVRNGKIDSICTVGHFMVADCFSNALGSKARGTEERHGSTAGDFCSRSWAMCLALVTLEACPASDG